MKIARLDLQAVAGAAAVAALAVAVLTEWPPAARAEEPAIGVLELEEEAAAAEDETATAAELLYDTPNYVEVLREQWSETQFEDLYGQYFGHLRSDGEQRQVTLEQAIALALQNNTGLEVRRLDPLVATNEVRRARSLFDPAVFAGVSKFRSKSPLAASSPFTATGRETFVQDVAWDVGLAKTLVSGGEASLEWTNNRLSTPPNVANLLVPRYESQINFSLAQPLLRDFGWKYALLRVEVAQVVEDAAFYEYKAQVADLVFRVEEIYWVLVLATENVSVEEQGLELAQELLRQNQGRFDVGALPRTAVLESEAEVARREANLVRARNLERIARDRLSNLVNTRIEPAGDVVLLDPVDQPALIEYQIDTRRSFERALATRPELIAARLNVNSRELLEKAAQNQLLPRLDFVGSFGLNGLGGEDAGPIMLGEDLVINADPRVDDGYDSALNLLTDGRFYQYNVGVRLEVPIANAAAKAEFTNSKIETERSKLNLRQLEENVTLEIKNAVDNVRSRLKSIEATRIARELAEENVRNQKARYDVGLATTKDLIDFQERLTRARQAEIEALTGYNTDVAELRRVDGTLLDFRNVAVDKRDPEGPPWWARF
jgi:outer membrane protein